VNEELYLRSTVVDGGLLLRLRQYFHSVHEPEAPSDLRWHVSTLAYDYRLSRAADDVELVSWHWHPRSGTPGPHLHVASAEVSRRCHLPSGRVSIEAVLRLLITEIGVPPLRADWAEVLDDSEALFIRHRRWHALTSAPVGVAVPAGAGGQCG
jgi:hypothetical protein